MTFLSSIGGRGVLLKRPDPFFSGSSAFYRAEIRLRSTKYDKEAKAIEAQRALWNNAKHHRNKAPLYSIIEQVQYMFHPER
jgi:hypothetical protein